MWLLPCVRRLTDILGQSQIGQEIHHFACGWVPGVVKIHVEVAKADECVCVGVAVFKQAVELISEQGISLLILAARRGRVNTEGADSLC